MKFIIKMENIKQLFGKIFKENQEEERENNICIRSVLDYNIFMI